jgi:hypothetical protein
MDARTAGRRMTELLNLTSQPVAVTFTAAAPPGVPRIAKAGPAGCAYWRLAAEGAVFTPSRRSPNCPVGSFTRHARPTGREPRTWWARWWASSTSDRRGGASAPVAPFQVAVYARWPRRPRRPTWC